MIHVPADQPTIQAALSQLVGDNKFMLFAVDVTPAPYNQPPYPPAGDSSSDTCLVTGLTPWKNPAGRLPA